MLGEIIWEYLAQKENMFLLILLIAATYLVLPILAKASIVLGVDPRILMIPATLSASCAFMMPVASPTQAIIFGSGRVPIKEMVRAGILFNLLGVIIIGGIFYLLANFVFGINI